MKAVVFHKYGGPEVMKLAEIEKPTPKEDEVLVRIRATAVNSGDWRLRKAEPFAVRFLLGLRKPRINVLGAVFAGEVESTGSNVTLFKKGDQVFGHTDMYFGSYAQYKSISQNGSLALMPGVVNYTEAAVIPFGGTTALHFLKKVNIQPGQKVLVNGASGAVGSAAVQLARYFGADVTGVCSTSNVELVKSLGANRVIDYTKAKIFANGEKYDVIFDTVDKLNFSECKSALTAQGVMVLSSAGMSRMLKGIWTNIGGRKKVYTGVIRHNAEAINFLKNLVEIGKLKPVIDRTFSMNDMAAAHAYVEKGHKKGNVAIEIQ